MVSWATEIFKLNGIDMHYLRTGGNKPPVVLLHGLMLSGACWTQSTLEGHTDRRSWPCSSV